MSWYVSQDGEQLWIARDETVYTLVECEEKLPLENLTYLTMGSRRQVYHECIVDEDMFADGKSKIKRRDRTKMSGRQRGFILPAQVEETPMQRVVPCFKAAAQKLVEDGEISRVDAEDAVNTKRKKNKEEKRVNLNLGVNECRVETTARVNHFAHGAGFRLQVSMGSITQRIHIYTHRRQIPFQEWHELLTEAMESTGSYVMLARRTEADIAKEGKEGDQDDDGIVQVGKAKKDKALQEENGWLERMMSMAGDKEDEDDSDTDSEDEKSAGGGRRSASVPPTSSRSTARSASPSRVAAGQRPAPAPALPSREPQQPEAARGDNRRASERNPRESDTRDWRHVRDPPRHVGYTTWDWGSQEAPTEPSWRPGSRLAAEAPEFRERPRDNHSRWSDQSRERPSRDYDEWKSRGPSRRSGFGGYRARGPGGDARPANASEVNSKWRDPKSPWDQSQSYRSGQRGKQPGVAPSPHRPQQQPHQQQMQPQPQAQPQAQAQAPKERAKALQDEESRTSKYARDQAAKCFECGRGKPLKLFIDDDDENPYCRACWVEFYGQEPPNK